MFNFKFRIMNKFLFTLLACTLLCGCNGSKNYNGKLKKTTQLMAELTFYSGHITDDYTNVWREAIYDKEYQGEYCSDFNEALSKHQEFVKGTSLYETVNLKKDTLDILIKELREYPSDYKESYDDIVSLYTDVDELIGYANTPSGSLTTYSSKTSNLVVEITKRIKEFNIKYIE